MKYSVLWFVISDVMRSAFLLAPFTAVVLLFALSHGCVLPVTGYYVTSRKSGVYYRFLRFASMMIIAVHDVLTNNICNIYDKVHDTNRGQC